LETLTEQLDHRAAEQAERSATEAVELALEIAAVILDREVAVAADPGAEAIARCLAVTPHDGELIAHLHPDDVHLLGEVAGLGARSLTVVADDRVRQGDAVVKIDESLVDGRLAGALDRVAEVLR
jgi:flagellar assembly protein FliH